MKKLLSLITICITKILTFLSFMRLDGMSCHSICILFPCFCPYEVSTRESFYYSILFSNHLIK